MHEHPAPGGLDASRPTLPGRTRPSAPRIAPRRALALVLAAVLVPAGGVLSAVATAADGDDGPATAARLNFPRGIALAPSGDLLIADTNNHRVRRVAPDGQVHPFAGGGGPTPALSASFSAPEGIAVAPGGGAYVADTLNNRIHRVGPDGSIALFAGSGASGFTGDGGPATAAAMSAPRGLAVDPTDGDVLLADVGSRVRRVDVATGTITTVAGNDAPGYTGDGVPATSTSLNRPTGLAFAPDGTLYVADTDNGRVRRVAPGAGTITTVAGTGAAAGPLGDGGPATAAALDDPRGVAVAPDGALLVTDTGHDRVRRVDPVTDVITTVAGTGAVGFAGDGGPATDAAFDEPTSIAVAPDGAVLVADSRNRRIRRFAVGGPITTIAGGESVTPVLPPDPPTPGPDVTPPPGPDVTPGTGATTDGGAPTTTPSGPATAPPAASAVASDVAGPVTLRRPGQQAFRPLTEDQVVTPGSEVDTSRGTLELTIRAPGGRRFRAGIDGGRFVFSRGPRRSGYLTDLRLTGPACRPAAPRNDRRAPTSTGRYPRPRRTTARRASLLVPAPSSPLLGSPAAPAWSPTDAAPRTVAKRRRSSRKLRVRRTGSGELRTRTNDGAAVARGTAWTTTESCSGTSYRVTEGRIAVRDLARGTSRTVRRGGRLTIRAQRPR